MKNFLADRLVRLPLWVGLEEHISEVVNQINLTLKK
jgi:hypothetical protein